MTTRGCDDAGFLAKTSMPTTRPHQLTVGRHDAGHGGKPGDAVLQETARPTSTLAILALLAVGCDDGCDDAGPIRVTTGRRDEGRDDLPSPSWLALLKEPRSRGPVSVTPPRALAGRSGRLAGLAVGD